MTYFSEKALKNFKENIDTIPKSGFFAEGQWTKKAESQLNNLFGTSCVLTNSWGGAFLSILSYFKEVKECNLAIFQSNTFYGDVQIARMLGYEIAYVSGDKEDIFNLSYDDLETLIPTLDKKYKPLVVCTHIGGWVNQNMDKIQSLCNNNNIPLVEDCAHSFMASHHNGQLSGTFGDAAAFSFYATKFLQAGEGGVISTKSQELYDYSKNYIKYSREKHHMIETKEDDVHVPKYGNNIRVSEFQALAISSALDNWKESFDIRKDYTSDFIDSLNVYPQHLKKPSENGHIYNNLYKLVIDKRKHNDKDINELKQSGLTFNYSCPIIDHNNNYPYISLPNSMEIFEKEQEEKRNYISLRTLP